MNPLLIAQFLLKDVVVPLIAKWKAENPTPGETDAQAFDDLNSALVECQTAVDALREASQ